MSLSDDPGGSRDIVVLKQPPVAGCPFAVGLFPACFHTHRLISSPQRPRKLGLAAITAPTSRKTIPRTREGNAWPRMTHGARQRVRLLPPSHAASVT